MAPSPGTLVSWGRVWFNDLQGSHIRVDTVSVHHPGREDTGLLGKQPETDQPAMKSWADMWCILGFFECSFKMETKLLNCSWSGWKAPSLLPARLSVSLTSLFISTSEFLCLCPCICLFCCNRWSVLVSPLSLSLGCNSHQVGFSL